MHGARLLLTSVERTQWLTAATASALVLSAVSLKLWCGRRRAAGLSPAMVHGGALRLQLRSRVEGRGRDAGDRMDGGLLGARVGVPTRGWRWPATARSSPAYGRHVADAGWDEAGVRVREREGEGGGRPGHGLGRKGGGVGPAAPAPFSFLLISFLKFFSKFIWTIINSFPAFAPERKVVPKQKLYNFVLISKTKFPI